MIFGSLARRAKQQSGRLTTAAFLFVLALSATLNPAFVNAQTMTDETVRAQEPDAPASTSATNSRAPLTPGDETANDDRNNARAAITNTNEVEGYSEEYGYSNDTNIGRGGAIPVPFGTAVNDDTPTAGLPPSEVPREMQLPLGAGVVVSPNTGGLNPAIAENSGASVPNVGDSQVGTETLQQETAANPVGGGDSLVVGAERGPWTSRLWPWILIISGVIVTLALWLMSQMYYRRKRSS